MKDAVIGSCKQDGVDCPGAGGGAHSEGIDKRIRQAGIDDCPARPIVRGTKHFAAVRSGEQVRPHRPDAGGGDHGETLNSAAAGTIGPEPLREGRGTRSK